MEEAGGYFLDNFNYTKFCQLPHLNTPPKTNMDFHKNAIFEKKYILKKDIILGIYVRFFLRGTPQKSNIDTKHGHI